MEKKMETTTEYWVYIGRMEKKMETTTEYWVYIGIMLHGNFEVHLFSLAKVPPGG